MIKVFKTLTLLFFLASVAAFVAAVWYTNWRLFFIGVLLLVFTYLSAALTEMSITLEKSRRPSIEDLFKNLDTKVMDGLEEK